MSLESEFDEAMLNAYRRAGQEAGYWGNYMNRDIKNKGGRATAKHMLLPRKSGSFHKGFQAIIDAGRVDLSIEYLVLNGRFRTLFTADELAEAQRRLDLLPAHVQRQRISPDQIHPETLPEGRRTYTEGAVQQVLVNVYERDANARRDCLKHHGLRCVICKMSFEECYGEIGKDFIHVHHLKPLAACREDYEIDPKKDLVPVCPNCHAMLHTTDPPLAVEELKAFMGESKKGKTRRPKN